MMQKCPECGSSEVVSDLAVFSDEAAIGLQLPYVLLKEPKPEKKAPFIWSLKSVATGFRAAVCGSCGYTRFYAKNHKEIWLCRF